MKSYYYLLIYFDSDRPTVQDQLAKVSNTIIMYKRSIERMLNKPLYNRYERITIIYPTDGGKRSTFIIEV